MTPLFNKGLNGRSLLIEVLIVREYTSQTA
jgi:hypothetical protein